MTTTKTNLTAQPRPHTRVVVLLLACALWLGTLAFVEPARAQGEPSSIDRDALTDLVFAAQVESAASGVDGLARVLLTAELIEWRAQNPAATAGDASSFLASRQAALAAGLTAQDLGLPPADYVLRAVTVLGTGSDLVAGSHHVRQLLDAAVGGSMRSFDGSLDAAEGALRTVQWLRNVDSVETAVWSELRRVAISDADVALAWTERIGSALGVDPRKALEEMTLGHVDIGALAEAGDVVAVARDQYKMVRDALDGEFDAVLGKLGEVTAACPATLDTTCSAAVLDAARAFSADAQQTIDAMAAGARLLAGVISAVNPALGENFATATSAVVSVLNGVNGYIESVAGRGTGGALLSAATMALTGNTAGAVMSLVGFGFGGGGPSADEIILQQVEALRADVARLGEQMQESFQRIEAQLAQIYSHMLAGFDAILSVLRDVTLSLAEIQFRLEQIQNQLAQLSLQLDEVAARILQAIGRDMLIPAREAARTYLGYEEKYGTPIPSYEEYVREAESKLYFAATELSKDPAFVVDVDPTTTDPVAVLDEYGEANALTYLSRLANAVDPTIPVPAEAPSLAVWRFAAQAYLSLQLQNPAYAARVNSSQSNDIKAVGEQITTITRRFSRPASTADATGNRTNQLFTKLIADYREGIADLSAALKAVQSVARRRLEAGGEKSKSYDLFGSATQSVPVYADPSGVGPCSGTTGETIARPSNVSYKSLAAALRFAAYAYSPALDSTKNPEQQHCYSVKWTGARKVYDTARNSEGYTLFGRLTLTIATRFRWSASDAWATARSKSFTWAEEQAYRHECTYAQATEYCYDWAVTPSDAFDRKNWTTEKPTFESDATTYTNTTLSTAAAERMGRFLNGRRHAFFAIALEKLHNPASSTHRAATKLNQATRKLQAFTRLGFPVALATDDLLSAALFGQYQLPANLSGAMHLDDTMIVAMNAYGCRLPGDTVGTPCATVGTFNPLANQPHFDTPCSTSGVSGLPGDPVGNCLIASATKRIGALAARYRFHSQRLWDGVYTEQVPWVATTTAALPVIDRTVRAAA